MAAAENSIETNFNREYEKVGPQLKKFIDTIEGPVHVIASPGTRTADLLALRVAGILLHTAALPEHILCFADADSSVANLQNKLQRLIGGDAQKVNIKTISGFCKQVMGDNGTLLDNRYLQPVSILESIKLFKKIIDNFPNNHLLKRYRSDVYHEINNLKSLFSIMKKERLTTEVLNQKMDALIPEEQEGFRCLSDIEKEEAIEMRLRFRAGINEFDHYQTLLQNENRYDKDDLVYLVANLFEANKKLLSDYLQQFRFIHIDMHKGTTHSFNKLLQLLIGADKKWNILAVTYEESEIMGTNKFIIESNTAFTNTLMKLPLTNNDHYPTSAGSSQRGNMPVIKIYQTERDEMAGITNQVNNLLQQKIPAGTIAVIYPTEDYCTSLAEYFNLKNINFHCCRKIDMLTHPFTKKIIQLLRYAAAEHAIPYSGDDLLFEILHFDFFKVPSFEIAKLSVEVNSKKYGKTPTTIRKLIQERANAPAKDLFDTGMDTELKKTSTFLEQLIREATHLNPAQLFVNTILDEQLQCYIDQQYEAFLLRNLLSALGDFIKQETTRNSQLQLIELIELIDIMETAKLPLPATINQESAKGIYFINVEEARNKEFDHVFIAGAHNLKEPKHEWLDRFYELPGIAFNNPPIDNRGFTDLLNEAFAGNKPGFYISLASYNEHGKELIPAGFVSEIGNRYQLPLNEINLSEDERKPYLLLENLLPEIAHLEDGFITPILDKFVMSVSALNSYLNCPLGFYYKNIIRIPDGKNEALQFGSAVHYALENLFKKMLEDRSVKQSPFPPVAELINFFKEHMQTNRIHFTKEAFERRWQYGERVLTNYYIHYINTWNNVVTIERNIRGITINNVPLKGKLDKLEFNGKDVNIVDYKSGDIEKALAKMNPPTEVHPNGGDYWRQAVFYKLLIDNYEQRDWKVVSTEFDFVEPDKRGAYRKEKIEVTRADVETVKQQLTWVWQKIQVGDFYTGCGKTGCHWCNFVKDNGLAIAMHPMKKESSVH